MVYVSLAFKFVSIFFSPRNVSYIIAFDVRRTQPKLDPREACARTFSRQNLDFCVWVKHQPLDFSLDHERYRKRKTWLEMLRGCSPPRRLPLGIPIKVEIITTSKRALPAASRLSRGGNFHARSRFALLSLRKQWGLLVV